MSKTKTMLVEVARQLFAKNGVQETTMNDIAEASGKGRRTLYTYFKNKEEIYLDCIEAELQLIATAMQGVLRLNMEPEDKIRTFIHTHFDVFKDTVLRNGNLNSHFFCDITEVEKYRRKLDQKEAVMLAQIIGEGKAKGVFKVDDVKSTAKILQLSLKGMEVPYIRESVLYRRSHINYIYEFLFFGLKGQRPDGDMLPTNNPDN
jgi:AcrR family transcriptional regulator